MPPQAMHIALMGAVGTGKSTFIQHCTNQRVPVGHQIQACTQEVQVYDCPFEGINVKLVDTPGFDDTHRSDTEVLKEIASWLAASYSSQINLRGIIWLHRISDRRMAASAKRNLRTFKKLCGPDGLNYVILATTMWENVDPQVGIDHEKELRDDPDSWGWMLQQGSIMERHTNDRPSAMKLISTLTSPRTNAETLVADIQREMLDQGKQLGETAAGIALVGEMAKAKDEEIIGLRAQIQEQREQIEKRIEEVQDQKYQIAELEKHLRHAEVQQHDIRESYEEMIKEKAAEYNQTIQTLKAERNEANRKRLDCSTALLDIVAKMQA